MDDVPNAMPTRCNECGTVAPHPREAREAVPSRMLQTEFDLAPFEVRLSETVTRIEAKCDQFGHDMTIRFGLMLAVAVGILLAAMRLMPHP